MEFWGVEIKAGEPLKIEPDDDMVIHLSQAVLGETKSKGGETVYLYVKIADQKFVLANLSLDKFPQVTFDLVFDQEVEVSHNWKNGSIHLCGYQAPTAFDGDDMGEQYLSDSSDEEAEVPVTAVENGKGAEKVAAKPVVGKSNDDAKPEAYGKAKVKLVEPSKDDEDDDSDDSDDDESDEMDSEDESDEDMIEGDDSSSDEEDDDETPKKPEVIKKRPTESATKTPVSSKKAKVASPKSDKKAAHVGTPHPSKKAAAKSPATTDKSKQTPKSAGQVSCKTCSKTFNSDKALESHTKAKHV
ncbi:histone deacetylase HDT1-like [Humulus lupulus]|uniref:histone deacetylase HDT1-like n=1 Tax=Humulus lupulus TaxID=3486 RepID=UPI002B4071F2|nr:histone deacetylase HDT1-like [Humulus lupulus]